MLLVICLIHLLFGCSFGQPTTIDQFYNAWSKSVSGNIESFGSCCVCEKSNIDTLSFGNTLNNDLIQLNKQYVLYNWEENEVNNKEWSVSMQLSYIEYNNSGNINDRESSTKCIHYNATHLMTLIESNDSICISSIKSLPSTIVKYLDYGNMYCSTQSVVGLSSLMLNVDLRNFADSGDTSDTAYSYDAQSNSFVFVSIGSIGAITWTLFYLIFHLSLLNYPSIYHTKTVIFCLFLSCSSNLILATYFTDQYQYIPNAVSLLFSMIHFATWGYHLQINIDAPNVYDLVHFTHRTRKSLLGMDTASYYPNNKENNNYNGNNSNNNSNNISISGNIEITTEQAKNNAQSIPYRRKARLKAREEQIKKALFASAMDSNGIHHGYDAHNSRKGLALTKKSLTDPYDTRLHKLLVTFYVILSMIVHFIVVFASDLYQTQATKYEIIGIYSLFQWMICLSFIVTWYQNFRIEYVTELVLQRNLQSGTGTNLPRVGAGGVRSSRGISLIRSGQRGIEQELVEFQKELTAITPKHGNNKNNNNFSMMQFSSNANTMQAKHIKNQGTMIIHNYETHKNNDSNNKNNNDDALLYDNGNDMNRVQFDLSNLENDNENNNNKSNNNGKNISKHLRGNTKGMVSSLALRQLEEGAPNPPTLLSGKKPIQSDVYGLIQTSEEVSRYYKQKLKKEKKSKKRKIKRFFKRCGMCCCHTLCCLCNVTFLSLLLNSIHYLPWIMIINSSVWIYYGAVITQIDVIWLPHCITCVLCVMYIFYSFCMDEEEMVFEQQNSGVTGTGGHTRYKTTAAHDWLPPIDDTYDTISTKPPAFNDQAFDYQLMH